MASLRSRQAAVTTLVLMGGGALLLLPLWRGRPALYGREDLEMSPHSYTEGAPVGCVVGSRPGPAGASPSEETARGIRYLVKTPSNCDPTRAHPLLVVFAPSGATIGPLNRSRHATFTPRRRSGNLPEGCTGS